MTLSIDTTQFNSVAFSLADEHKPRARARQKIYKIAAGGNHQTVSLLEKFLRAQKIKPSSIKKIIVSAGPGSFNGIRVGASIAQALSLAWKVPVQVK